MSTLDYKGPVKDMIIEPTYVIYPTMWIFIQCSNWADSHGWNRPELVNINYPLWVSYGKKQERQTKHKPEDTIHGKPISQEEALKDLGDPKDWPAFKEKVMADFKQKPN
jgi:hypothetical protein